MWPPRGLPAVVPRLGGECGCPHQRGSTEATPPNVCCLAIPFAPDGEELALPITPSTRRLDVEPTWPITLSTSRRERHHAPFGMRKCHGEWESTEAAGCTGRRNNLTTSQLRVQLDIVWTSHLRTGHRT